MNIYARFETVFNAARGARALTCPGGAHWSYERLLAEVHRAAAVLVARNVLPGDRVLVQVEKTPQAVAVYLACLKVGAVYVPINPAYTAPEVAYFIADCQPQLFIAGGRLDTSAPKPGRRFAFAMRRLRLRPSHADLPWNIHLRSLRSLRRLFHGSAPKPGRRFAFAMRRLRLRPSHADLPWNIHLRSLRSLRRLFHGSAPKPGRRFAFAMRRLRLRPSHADLPWNIHLRSLRSLWRLFHARVDVAVLDGEGGGSFWDGAQGVSATTVDRADEDMASIIYTSGTTGRSKGAMLTHANLMSNAETLCAAWGWRDDDVLLHALPMFHVHGLFVALHCAFLNATPVIFLPRFDATAILGELPHATVLMGVPTFYARLLNEAGFDAAACANMRLFISGSAPLNDQTFAAFERRTGFAILERYGMSETLMNTSNPLRGARIAGTVGFALPGIEVRIADDAGQPLAAGEVGGIEVRGPNVFKGYWRQPGKTADEFRADGFFVTGDMGTMDGEGTVAIVGRAKDLVISGGYNIYPKEVEALIDEMPEVVESAVIGVPHPDFGEAVVAVVVAQDSVDQARMDAFLKGRLARYKQPKRVICIDELPHNAMGKVQKNVLRDRCAEVFVDG